MAAGKISEARERPGTALKPFTAHPVHGSDSLLRRVQGSSQGQNDSQNSTKTSLPFSPVSEHM